MSNLGVAEDVIAAVAALIVCSDKPPSRADIARQVNINQGAVTRSVHWLIEQAYVRELPIKGRARQPGASRRFLQATEALLELFEYDDMWRQALLERRLCIKLNLSIPEVRGKAVEMLARHCKLI